MHNSLATNYYTLGANVFSFNVTSNMGNVNIRTLAINAGWDQTGDIEVRFVGTNQLVGNIKLQQNYPGNVYIYIGPGCTVGGADTNTAAINVIIPINNPTVVGVFITNDGKWYGAGGNSGGGQDCWAQGRFQGNPVVWGYGASSVPGQRMFFNGIVNDNTTSVSILPPGTNVGGSCESYNGATTGGSNSFTVCGGDSGTGGTWGVKGSYGGLASITGSPGSSGTGQWYSPGDPGMYLYRSPNNSKFTITISKLGTVLGRDATG